MIMINTLDFIKSERPFMNANNKELLKAAAFNIMNLKLAYDANDTLACQECSDIDDIIFNEAAWRN